MWSLYGFLYMSSARSDNVASFLPIWIPFMSCLIAVAETSNVILNIRDESGPPGLVPDFSRRVFSFSFSSF